MYLKLLWIKGEAACERGYGVVQEKRRGITIVYSITCLRTQKISVKTKGAL